MQFLIQLATGKGERQRQIFLRGKLLSRALGFLPSGMQSLLGVQQIIYMLRPQPSRGILNWVSRDNKACGLVNGRQCIMKSQGLQSGGSYHRNGSLLLEGESHGLEKGGWGSETSDESHRTWTPCKVAQCVYVIRGSEERSVDLQSLVLPIEKNSQKKKTLCDFKDIKNTN